MSKYKATNPKSRLIRGKRYWAGMWFPTKAEAKDFKKDLKKLDVRAVVLKSVLKYPNGSTEKGYRVYHRKA